MADLSVQSICNMLVQGRLQQATDVRNHLARWQRESKDSNDVGRFTKWLIANRIATEYQVSLMLKGQYQRFYLNQYKILDRLGQGRMAGVYEAVHQTGYRVAIKVLPPSKTKDPQIFGRFQREGRMAMKLAHPNVVRTYHLDEDNGLHFIVMEYLDGITLDELLEMRGRLPPPEAARLIHQALLGLQQIHDEGMVHRDMKPANLMLVVPSHTGKITNTQSATVKILDIGLGRAIFEDTGLGENQQLTTDGAILGTPDYLAPEQARHAHSADIRADIYSLGCVLYEMLTAQPPFPDKNIVNKMVKHATEPPRPIKELNPAVPDDLQQVVSWMLMKDPAQRPPTPERAAQALQQYLTRVGEPPAPPKPPPPEPKMQAYLAWLQGHLARTGAGVTPPPRMAATVPVAVSPIAARAAPALPAGVSVDVEPVQLVPIDPQGQPVATFHGKPVNLNRRDYTLMAIGLGIGIGAVIAIGTIIWLVALLMRR